MKCTITVDWNSMTPEDREGLLSFLHSEEFKELPLWLRWMAAISPEERVFEAPKDTGRFSGHEYHFFLELLRVLAEHYPSLDAEIRGHVGSGIRKFDLGGYFTVVIRNGELCEDYTGIP